HAAWVIVPCLFAAEIGGYNFQVRRGPLRKRWRLWPRRVRVSERLVHVAHRRFGMIRSSPSPSAARSPDVEAYLLGTVDYEACLALQNRLVYEASGGNDGRISLLVCEHPPIITVGRRGSW